MLGSSCSQGPGSATAFALHLDTRSLSLKLRVGAPGEGIFMSLFQNPKGRFRRVVEVGDNSRPNCICIPEGSGTNKWEAKIKTSAMKEEIRLN